MTLAPTELTVEVGKTGTAQVSITPTDTTNQSITAKSADETKVTVTVSGKTLTISGVAATDDGTPVQVTATVDGKSTTLAVTVTAAA